MPCHLPIDVCNSQRSFYLRFSSCPRRAASLNNAARNGKVEKGGDFKHVEYFPFHFFGLSSFPLFIDELHHFSRWLLHHQPVTTSYFQFLEPESSQDPVLEPTVVAFHVSLQPRSWSVFGGSVDHFTRTVLFGLLVCFGHVSGWWFGTWLLFSHNIWDNPSAIDELIFFRGVGIPPGFVRAWYGAFSLAMLKKTLP